MPADRVAQPDAIDVGLKLGNTIVQIVNAPMRTAYANRIFGEFKRACEQLGIRDDDPLGSIEYGVSQYSTGYIRKDVDDDGAVEIREVSRSEVK